MKNSLKCVVATACLAFATSGSHAQPVFQDSIRDVHSGSDQNQQIYSQAQSLTERLPLDLMAVNEPSRFEGLPVMDNEGTELGKVMSIARKKTDQTLHAVLTTGSGEAAAVKLDELTLGAFAYWDPAGSLADGQFREADFEPVSQYQTGHSAWGSLTNPTVEPVQVTLDQEPDQVSSDNESIAASETLFADDANRSGGISAANPVYEPVDSSIVQLALNHPDAFQGRLLIGEDGENLGEVAYVARNLTDQELYAVIDRGEGNTPSAVELSALTAGQLFFQGQQNGRDALPFDESEFENVPRR